MKDITLEAYEEHQQVKTLIREVGNLAGGSEKSGAKLKVMKENVEHHVGEEEDEMFPQVRRIFDAADLDQLGQEMEAAKQEYSKKQRSSSSGSRK